MFQAQPISTHHKPSMHKGFPSHLIIMPLWYQPFHAHFMPRVHSSLSFINHTLSHTFTIHPTCHYTIVPPIAHQTQKSREINTQPARTLAQTGRSGQGVSLRREGLSLRRVPLRLGENSITLAEAKTPARLGELTSPGRGSVSLKTQGHPPGRPLAQKVWANLCQTRLGKSEARLPGLALNSLATDIFPKPTNHTRYPNHHKQRFIHTNIQQAQQQIKDNSKTNQRQLKLETLTSRTWRKG